MPNHLPTILNWAAEEGWNPGIDDGEAFLAADPDGFFTHDVDGQPVAAISVVNHSDDFAFLGLYLCRPEYRGQGLGLNLWNRAIQHAGSRSIGLDGVPDQQANYRKSGFVLHGQTIRWQGSLAAKSSPAIAPTVPQRGVIAQRDHQQTGFARQRFLNRWLVDTASRKTLVIERAGKVAAYGTIRKCREGTKIGPFAADDDRDALDLLSALAGVFGRHSENVMIDIPAHSSALADHVKALEFVPGFETPRMYKGIPPVENLARFSAVATLELG